MSMLIRPDMIKEQIDTLEKTPFQFQDSFFGDGFTPFPKSIQLNPALSIQARFLYGILLSFAWGEKFSYPRIRELSYLMNLSQPMINKYLKELEEAGVIYVKRRESGKTNLYIFREIPNTVYERFTLNHSPVHKGSSPLERRVEW